MHLSSLSTPQFATSYTLGTVGMIDGSISYLFSTLPLDATPSQSNLIPLRLLVPGYRQIFAPTPASPPLQAWKPQEETQLVDIDGLTDDEKAKRRKAMLLHATLHLPPPTTLTALFLRRLSPTTQLTLALSSSQAPSPYKSVPQASILTQLSYDTGKYSSEFIFSTDNALLGLRGLWNFGSIPHKSDKVPSVQCTQSSLVSAGGEFYYSPVSRVVGLSTGIRFTTLPPPPPPPTNPSAPGAVGVNGTSPAISTFPYTLTLTLTPLTGSLSTTYSLLASPNLAFSSRFGFNVYSWESEMVAGCEIWRRSSKHASSHDHHHRTRPGAPDNLEWARRKMGLAPGHGHVHVHDSAAVVPLSGDSSSPHYHPAQAEEASAEQNTDSVLKLRVDQSWNIRLLWEGRVKHLLVSAGVGLGPCARSSIHGGSGSASGASGASAGASGAGGETSGGRSGYGWTGVGVSIGYSS